MKFFIAMSMTLFIARLTKLTTLRSVSIKVFIVNSLAIGFRKTHVF